MSYITSVPLERPGRIEPLVSSPQEVRYRLLTNRVRRRWGRKYSKHLLEVYNGQKGTSPRVSIPVSLKPPSARCSCTSVSSNALRVELQNNEVGYRSPFSKGAAKCGYVATQDLAAAILLPVKWLQDSTESLSTIFTRAFESRSWAQATTNKLMEEDTQGHIGPVAPNQLKASGADRLLEDIYQIHYIASEALANVHGKLPFIGLPQGRRVTSNFKLYHNGYDREVCVIFPNMIGQGSFKKVYKAWSLSQKKMVAAVIGSTDEAGLFDFQQQTKMLGVLSDLPTVTRVHSAAITTGQNCLIDDLYTYGTLDAISSSKKLNKEEKLVIMHDILFTLAQLHKKGIVHRDIKRNNLYVHRNSEGDISKVIVGDFGLACFKTNALAMDRLAGTPIFLSPEEARSWVFKGVAHSGTSRDVWATGILLMQTLFGGTLPRQKEVAECRRLDFKSVLAPLLRPGFQEEHDQLFAPEIIQKFPMLKLLGKMLEPDPKKRWNGEQAFAFFQENKEVLV